jgi:hypothetical protein
MEVKLKTLISLIIIIASLNLTAQVKKPSVYKHEGIFLRGTAGIGYANLFEKAANTYGVESELEISGISYDVNLQAGYTIAKNLQLYVIIGANIIGDPAFKFNGITSTSEVSTSANLTRYGFGTSYYFDPENIYLSFDITSGRNEIGVSNQSASSRRGLIFNVGLGKEWWVEKNLAIGGMIYFYTGSIEDEPFGGQTPSISNTGVGVDFAVTFN